MRGPGAGGRAKSRDAALIAAPDSAKTLLVIWWSPISRPLHSQVSLSDPLAVLIQNCGYIESTGWPLAPGSCAFLLRPRLAESISSYTTTSTLLMSSPWHILCALPPPLLNSPNHQHWLVVALGRPDSVGLYTTAQARSRQPCRSRWQSCAGSCSGPPR